MTGNDTDMVLPIIKSDNLELQTLSVDDAEAIFPLIDHDRVSMCQYLHWVNEVVDVVSTRSYLENRISSEVYGVAWYKILYAGQVAGVFGVKSINRATSTAEIGYWLSSHYQGKGIVAQCISSIADLLRIKHSIHYLEIRCLENNTASIAVAQRAGAKHIDTIPGDLTSKGELQGMLVYRIDL